MFALPSLTKTKNERKRQGFKQQQKSIASRHAAFMAEAVKAAKSEAINEELVDSYLESISEDPGRIEKYWDDAVKACRHSAIREERQETLNKLVAERDKLESESMEIQRQTRTDRPAATAIEKLEKLRHVAFENLKWNRATAEELKAFREQERLVNELRDKRRLLDQEAHRLGGRISTAQASLDTCPVPKEVPMAKRLLAS